MSGPHAGRGAALIVCLALAAALGVLAVASIGDMTTELAMTRNLALDRSAVLAAAAGIDTALASAPFAAEQPLEIELRFGPLSQYRVIATVQFVATSEIPGGGFSMGGGSLGLTAYHFEIDSVATGPRGARSAQRQGFYVLGPTRPET